MICQIEEKMEEKIELSKKEIQDLTQKQNSINKYISALGTLRVQFLEAENQLIEKMRQAEYDFMNLLKFIFQNKTEEDINEWIFDQETFTFQKKNI